MALLACLVASLLVSSCSGLYFLILESDTRCFIEEIPDEMMIVGQPPICFVMIESRNKAT